MQLQWGKCTSGSWCDFMKLDLAHSVFDGLEGVYIIWHSGDHPATVYVGQGVIKDRTQAHRSEPEILAFSGSGLFVTWASVDRASRDGVERFLADSLKPKVGTTHPQTAPIAVNLPW